MLESIIFDNRNLPQLETTGPNGLKALVNALPL